MKLENARNDPTGTTITKFLKFISEFRFLFLAEMLSKLFFCRTQKLILWSPISIFFQGIVYFIHKMIHCNVNLLVKLPEDHIVLKSTDGMGKIIRKSNE